MFSFQDVVNRDVRDIHHAGNLGIGATPVVFQGENLGDVFLLKLLPPPRLVQYGLNLVCVGVHQDVVLRGQSGDGRKSDATAFSFPVVCADVIRFWCSVGILRLG